MELTIRQVISRRSAIMMMLKKRLPVKVGYALCKNSKALDEEAMLFEERRISICEAAAEKDETGAPVMEIHGDLSISEVPIKQYVIPEELRQKVNADIEQLLDTVTDVPIMTISVEEFSQIDADTRYDPVSAQELLQIDFMIS